MCVNRQLFQSLCNVQTLTYLIQTLASNPTDAISENSLGDHFQAEMWCQMTRLKLGQKQGYCPFIYQTTNKGISTGNILSSSLIPNAFV